MKKKLMKSTLAVALVAAAAFGGVKTYGTYAPVSQSDLLLSENVDALGGSFLNGLEDWAYKYFLDQNYDSNAKLTSQACPSETTTTTSVTQSGEVAAVSNKGIGSASSSTTGSYSTTTKITKYEHVCTYSFGEMCDRREQDFC